MTQVCLKHLRCIFSTFILYPALVYRMDFKNKEDPVTVPRELKNFALKFQSNLMYVISSLSKG